MNEYIDTEGYASVYYKYEQEDCVSKQEKLNASIKRDIESCKSKNRKKVLETILNMSDFTDKEFHKKEWLYNNGYLRSLSDIHDYNSHIEKEMYYKNVWSKQSDGNSVCYIMLAVQFVITSIIFISGIRDINLGVMALAVVLKLISYILIIAYSLGKSLDVLSEAKKHNIPQDDFIVQKAKFNLGLFAITVAKKGKEFCNNVKESTHEIMNPDEWSIHI